MDIYPTWLNYSQLRKPAPNLMNLFSTWWTYTQHFGPILNMIYLYPTWWYYPQVDWLITNLVDLHIQKWWTYTQYYGPIPNFMDLYQNGRTSRALSVFFWELGFGNWNLVGYKEIMVFGISHLNNFKSNSIISTYATKFQFPIPKADRQSLSTQLDGPLINLIDLYQTW